LVLTAYIYVIYAHKVIFYAWQTFKTCRMFSPIYIIILRYIDFLRN